MLLKTHPKPQHFIVFLLVFVICFTSCEDQENKEREIRRILTKQILNRFNQVVKDINLTPENENYLATIKLENSRNMQVLFIGTPEKYEIVETLNSELARKISNTLNVNCMSMSVKKIDSLTSKGSGTLETGEQLHVFYDRQRGWYPTDQSSLEVVTKYQISDNIGVKCTQVTMIPADSSMYKGKAFLASKDTLAIMINPKQGWFPVDELNNLLKLTRLQIEAKSKQKVSKITGKIVEKGIYEATIYSDKNEELRLQLQHDGTNFKWKVIQ